MASKIYYRIKHLKQWYYSVTLCNEQDEKIGEFTAKRGDNVLLEVERYFKENNITIKFNELIPI